MATVTENIEAAKAALLAKKEKAATTTAPTAQFPHYYEATLFSSENGSTRNLYGKIEENGFHTTIIETVGYSKIYEIERTVFGSIELSGLAQYFDERYNSSEQDYVDAKFRCIEFLNA